MRAIATTTEGDRLLDVNVLLALSVPAHLHREAAHAWFEARVAGSWWGTCPFTEASFIRLMCTPAVTGFDYSTTEAVGLLKVLHALPGHRFIADPTSLAITSLDLTAMVGPKQVTDFHLVNLAAASGAVLATFDRRLAEALSPKDRHLIEVIQPIS